MSLCPSARGTIPLKGNEEIFFKKKIGSINHGRGDWHCFNYLRLYYLHSLYIYCNDWNHDGRTTVSRMIFLGGRVPNGCGIRYKAPRPLYRKLLEASLGQRGFLGIC